MTPQSAYIRDYQETVRKSDEYRCLCKLTFSGLWSDICSRASAVHAKERIFLKIPELKSKSILGRSV
ncbi:hypothetical protein MSHOH_2342 [Methanosarcina horonobensis HB-1 = JCM 15518]|uniref:Uncharacterized protein n=1 Tax=Methanosarcina horonobensis HB-1 = JCM 15518 TaxID=1434110 RepID=A0A0E3WW05_9EURY|nr:hypothetical protein MSHOH_2342 [Methanosarcina horonobensis HB-1 = JCM 15518]